jgi:hypothetical protein
MEGPCGRVPGDVDKLGGERYKFGGRRVYFRGIASAETVVHADVLALYPSRFLHRFSERSNDLARDRVVRARC